MRLSLFIVLLFIKNGVYGETGSGFSCEGRASGYYADIDSGCQVYHMCDGLGRQFSYSCPNTTLFQQRMLICDHWYMVNCSKSELDYNANLLIGQKDKPFVDDSSENPYHRTPRPDLETHPYAPRFQNDYRQAKSHFKPTQNLVGVETENRTDGPQYILPSHWSTQYAKISTTPLPFANKKYNKNQDKSTSPLFRNEPKVIKNTKTVSKIDKKETTNTARLTISPQFPKSTFPTTLSIGTDRRNPQIDFQPTTTPRITPRVPIVDTLGLPNPSKVLLPPKPDIPVQQSTFKPIIQQPRPLPKSPRIIDSQIANSFKSPQPTRLDIPPHTKPSTEKTIFQKSSNGLPLPSSIPIVTNEIEPPSIYYQPPKLTSYYDAESTTMDPKTFYELAKDLEPPKFRDRSDDDKTTITKTTTTLRSVTKKDTGKTEASPALTTETDDNDADQKWRDLRKMFFIPEYDFPLDLGSRPSYDTGISSFQVKQAPPNPEARHKEQEAKCDPKCDPAFLNPGTCKPCVMIR